MGNHEVPCAFCGEDTRGLSGVSSCSNMDRAVGCTYYHSMEARRERSNEVRHSMDGANDRKPTYSLPASIIEAQARRENGGLDGYGTRRTLHPQMRERTRVYFAHPMIDYDSTLETSAIAAILQELGPEVEVVNPNHPDHERAYKERGDFSYWTELAASCGVVVYMAMPCGWIGSGVWKEVDSALRAGRRVYEVYRETRNLLRVEYLDPGRCLSIEETRRVVKMFFAWKEGR